MRRIPRFTTRTDRTKWESENNNESLRIALIIPNLHLLTACLCVSLGSTTIIAYNRPPMALERLYLFTFVIYCTTVGTVLVMMPWSPAWDQLLLHLPFDDIRLLQSQWSRGILTGFGLVHLIWSVHDLNLVLNPSLLSEHRSHRIPQAEPARPEEPVEEAEPAEPNTLPEAEPAEGLPEVATSHDASTPARR